MNGLNPVVCVAANKAHFIHLPDRESKTCKKIFLRSQKKEREREREKKKKEEEE